MTTTTATTATTTNNNSAEHCVLVVDDCPVQTELLEVVLGEDYRVLTASSGEAALELLDSGETPDIVLLDVDMPGMGGYETCAAITEKYGLDVIFLSGRVSTDEIIKGYGVGAMDYVTKPFDIDVLPTKIKKTIQTFDERNGLKEQKKAANDLAMTAMFSSGELAVLLGFLRNSIDFSTDQQLADGILSTCGEFSLNSCLKLVSPCGTKVINKANHGSVSPLEEEILTRVRNSSERIISTGKRMIFNYDGVVLLVKNMPIEDQDKVGRLRDHLAILCEGANQCLQTLFLKSGSALEMKERLQKVIDGSTQTISTIEKGQTELKNQSVEIMDDMIADIEEAFFSLGLTGPQEENVLAILNASVEKSLKNVEKANHLDASFKAIISELSAISDGVGTGK